MKTKTIYIVLTRSTTVLSKVVYMATRGEYTHSAISLDDSFETLYTFSRRNPKLLLPAGFVTESVYEGIMGNSDDMNCAVYELHISNAAYKKLSRMLGHMHYHKEKYRYSISGLITCFFQKKRERKGYFFCSQFVYHALSESGAIEKTAEPSLVKPMHLKDIPEVKEIFKGTVSELRSNWRGKTPPKEPVIVEAFPDIEESLEEPMGNDTYAGTSIAK